MLPYFEIFYSSPIVCSRTNFLYCVIFNFLSKTPPTFTSERGNSLLYMTIIYKIKPFPLKAKAYFRKPTLDNEQIQNV